MAIDTFSMSKLYIMRHGQAQPGERGIKDEDRPLTSEGEDKVRKMVALAQQLGAKIDLIVSSPYRRAIHTAEIAKEILKPKSAKIIVDKSLEPERTPYEVYAFLAKERRRLRSVDMKTTLIISHKPCVEDLISDLLGSAGMNLAFPPASLSRIDVAESVAPSTRTGTLKWLVSSDSI